MKSLAVLGLLFTLCGCEKESPSRHGWCVLSVPVVCTYLSNLDGNLTLTGCRVKRAGERTSDILHASNVIECPME
jgi:hypothetical protein